MKKYLVTAAMLIVASITVYVCIEAICIEANTFEPIVFEQDVEYVSNAKIVLAAPVEAKIGELVILDASASEAASFKWRVIPETRDFEIIEDGKRAFFTSRKPGLYLFFIAAAKDNAVDCIVHELQIIGNPITDEFTILIKSWLPEKYDRRVLEALARSFIASSEAESIETLVKQTSIANQAVLGNKLNLYKPFLIKLSEHLKQNYADASLEEHISLWLKLAETLKTC